MNNAVIRHDGVVKSIEGQHVRVTILQASACGGCAARALCSSAEAKEKEVDVWTTDAAAFSAGQTVVLEGRIADGRRAALVAYGLPLLLLLPTLFFGIRATGSETTGALLALGSVVIYYLCVFIFFRKRLQRQFSFTIKMPNRNNNQ